MDRRRKHAPKMMRRKTIRAFVDYALDEYRYVHGNLDKYSAEIDAIIELYGEKWS